MDLDLRRCRRTDGKKWRCKREVVANEKYCESHMHRGRDRSRKLVEISDHLAANSDAAILINLKRGGNLKTNCPVICPVKIRSPKDAISDDKAVMNAAKNKSKENAAVKFLIRSSTSNDAAASRKKECSRANDGDVKRSHHFIDVPKDDSGNTVTKNVNAAVSTNSEFDFSPKSVLRGESSRQNRNLANTVESEPGRCRRTDGKKWRCRKDVLPDQKYCEAHVHRGSKRRILSSQVAADSTSTAPSFKANLAKSGGVGSSSNAACSVDSSDTNASTDVSELSTTSECQ